MRINQAWIDEQRKVCEAATVAPWTWGGDVLTSHWTDVISVFDNEGGASFSLEIDESDRAFIATARTALPTTLDALEAAQKENKRVKEELSAQRIAFQKLYGNHQRGISPKVITCPVCGGVEDVRLTQRQDAPELFGVSCGECGGHATIQLFADPDEIARLTAERDAAVKDMQLIAEDEIPCVACQIYNPATMYENATCETCANKCEFVWRSLCAENAPTGAGSEGEHA